MPNPPKRLKRVYRSLSPEDRRKLLDFWLGLGVLSPEQALERADQAVYLCLNEADEIIGVNTVYVDHLLLPNNLYYFYRTLIHPDYRNSYQILISMINATYDLLKAQYQKGKGPKGLAFAVENEKLAKTLFLARFRETTPLSFERFPYLYAGRDGNGQDLWYRNFF